MVAKRWPWVVAQNQGATHARASQFVRDLASVMSAAVSTRNPAPCDLGMAVMKVKANGDMCTRDDDEATNDDDGVPRRLSS